MSIPTPDFLLCPICRTRFNGTTKKPISLLCGHTCCSSCLQLMHRKQCPLDATPFQQVITRHQGQKEIAACTESRFFPLFATNFMYSLMYSLLKIAVSRILAKIIAKSFCPCTAHISQLYVSREPKLDFRIFDLKN